MRRMEERRCVMFWDGALWVVCDVAESCGASASTPEKVIETFRAMLIENARKRSAAVAANEKYAMLEKRAVSWKPGMSDKSIVYRVTFNECKF